MELVRGVLLRRTGARHVPRTRVPRPLEPTAEYTSHASHGAHPSREMLREGRAGLLWLPLAWRGFPAWPSARVPPALRAAAAHRCPHVMLQALPSGVTAEDLHVTVTTVCTLNIVLVKSMKIGLWFIPRLGQTALWIPSLGPPGEGCRGNRGSELLQAVP